MGAGDLEAAGTIDAGLAADLRAVGVHDLRDLRAVGAAEAWERLWRADLRDGLGDRLALEAAARDRRMVASLDPEVRAQCAEHVRRRRAPEPVRAPAASRYSVAPTAPVNRTTPRDRRRILLVLAIFALPVIAYLVARLLV